MAKELQTITKEDVGTIEDVFGTSIVESLPTIKIPDAVEMIRGEETAIVALHEECAFLDKGWRRICQ